MLCAFQRGANEVVVGKVLHGRTSWPEKPTLQHGSELAADASHLMQKCHREGSLRSRS